MISSHRRGNAIVFEGGLPHGTHAFIDADWISSEGVSSLVATSGEFEWDGNRWPIQGHDVGAAAAGLLANFAATAVRTARDHGCSNVGVSGRGAIAGEVVRLLGPSPNSGDLSERPDGWVVCEGTSDAIHSALARVADSGVVILCGPTSGLPFALDLYRDIHLRSLAVVGLDLTHVAGSQSFPQLVPAPFIDAEFDEPATLGPCYRLSGRPSTGGLTP